jgi:hypothetical protein
VAADAAAFAGEEFQAADLLRRERFGVTCNPPVEACRRGYERALIGRERPRNIARRDLGIVREGRGEVALVAFMPRKAVNRVVERVAHLVGMLYGKPHLLFQACSPAVPEQKRAEGHVPERRCVPHQRLAGDAFAAGLAVAERELGIVAGGAGDGAGRGELLVLEQALAQRDPRRRRRIVRGVGDEAGTDKLGFEGGECVLLLLCVGNIRLRPERQ